MARLLILLPLKLVVGGGVEPPMFTTWVTVLQTVLFGHLEKPYNKLVVQAGFGPANASVSDSCRNQAWRLDNGSGWVRESCTAFVLLVEGKVQCDGAVSLCHATLKFRWDMWELNPGLSPITFGAASSGCSCPLSQV